MVDYQTLSIVLTGVGLIIALIYYSMTLRYTSRARLREVIFQKASMYDLEYSKAFAAVMNMTDWETAEEFNAKYGPTVNPDQWAMYAHITRLYNIGGIVLQENMADDDLVFKLYPPFAVIRLWEQLEVQIVGLREQRNYPLAYEPFEYLYKQAKQRYPEIITP